EGREPKEGSQPFAATRTGSRRSSLPVFPGSEGCSRISTPQIRQQSRSATHQVGHILAQKLAQLLAHVLGPIALPRFPRITECHERLPGLRRNRQPVALPLLTARA